MDSKTQKQFDRFKAELLGRCSKGLTDQDRYLTKLCLEINNITKYKLISAKDINRLLKNLEQIDLTLIKASIINKIQNYLNNNIESCYVINMSPYIHDERKYVFSENNFINISFKVTNYLKVYLKSIGYFVYSSNDPKLSTLIFFFFFLIKKLEGTDILSGKKIVV